MNLRSPTENEKEYFLRISTSARVRHSRMLLAGIQAEFGLDPRLKHSGVTDVDVFLLSPAYFSKGGHEKHEEIYDNLFLIFVVLRDLRG
jgi:hypothetical protein